MVTGFGGQCCDTAVVKLVLPTCHHIHRLAQLWLLCVPFYFFGGKAKRHPGVDVKKTE